MIRFVDVGTGDCSVVVDRATAQGLIIDCPAGGVRKLSRQLSSDAELVGASFDVIVTHWDEDHYLGAIEIAGFVRARALYYNHDTLLSDVRSDRTRRLATLRQLLDAPLRDTELLPVIAGASHQMGHVVWLVLAPTQRELTQAVVTGDRNAASVVVQIDAYDERVLVGGDADGQTWRRLSYAGSLPRAGTLRTAHHGGMQRGNASGMDVAALLDHVQPSRVVISVGSRNRNGHPHPAVVDSAMGVGARVMCTQVTPRCNPSGVGAATPCAGDVTLKVAPGAATQVYPEPAIHHPRIAAWEQPMCWPAIAPTNTA
jgi:beta-lactamase superfamily II metal-dependent hydrolase